MLLHVFCVYLWLLHVLCVQVCYNNCICNIVYICVQVRAHMVCGYEYNANVCTGVMCVCAVYLCRVYLNLWCVCTCVTWCIFVHGYVRYVCMCAGMLAYVLVVFQIAILAALCVLFSVNQIFSFHSDGISQYLQR